jgi:hypothetical protein
MQLIKTLIIAATALVSLSSSVLAADPKLNVFKTARPVNFCKKSGLLAANGTQIRSGFCSSTVQGAIPDVTKMTSTLITFPRNGGSVIAGKNFTVKVKLVNLATGFFSDPVNDYYDFPQNLNRKGIIEGHSHITIQKLDGDKVPDATVFAFFKGLNLEAINGLLTQVANLPLPGLYRMCTMSSSLTHQPVIMPVAQRGAQDDCIRFKVKKR